MRHEMLAFCGLDCQSCPAYIATRENDDEKRKAAAEKWSTPQYPVKVEDINCGGCKQEGAHFKWCYSCAVRGCASEKGVATCAHCQDYEGCESLKSWLAQAGEDARKTLESIRSPP